MAELVTLGIAEQLGLAAADPIQLANVPGQFLVTGEHVLAPNSIANIDGGYACWLAPRRRLAVTGVKPNGFSSDMSDGMAIFTIDPLRDSLFLAIGCALAPAALEEGRCAQTMFAGLKLLLYRRHGLIHLHVERPLAAHLLLWFRQTETAL
jgi:hypothetical protein